MRWEDIASNVQQHETYRTNGLNNMNYETNLKKL